MLTKAKLLRTEKKKQLFSNLPCLFVYVGEESLQLREFRAKNRVFRLGPVFHVRLCGSTSVLRRLSSCINR